MELVLAKDSVNQIMGYLNDKELYMYGAASKMCNQSSELEWRRRVGDPEAALTSYLEYWGCARYEVRAQAKDIFYWRRLYILLIQIECDKIGLDSGYDFYLSSSELKKACDLMVRRPEIRKMTKYFELVSLVKKTLKLYWFDLDFKMFELAQKYLDLLFPHEYLVMLAEGLYPNGIFYGKEEVDY